MTERISVEREAPPRELRSLSDLRVNMAVVLAFMLQTATAFMWAGAAENRIGQLETRVATREQFFERTARLEENVDAIRDVVDRLEAKVDQLQTNAMQGDIR